MIGGFRLDIETLLMLALSIWFIIRGLTFNEKTLDYKYKQIKNISKYISINKKSYISLGLVLIISSLSYIDIITTNVNHIYLRNFRVLCGIFILFILIFYKRNIRMCINKST